MSYTNGLDKPSEYFNTLTWTGDDASPRSLTGVGFQPDFIWGKARSRIGNHWLIDSIRGSTGSLYRVLNSDDTASEQTTNGDGTTAYGIVTTIGSDGFTVADGDTGDENVNNTGDTYVAWNWIGNGAGVSNTDGTITSTVSANTTSGFSIVSFDLTGQTGVNTVGHGLGAEPKVVITKRRSGGAGDWTSYFGAIGNSYLVLNSTGASATNADFMNNTAPTSSVFTVGDPTWWSQSPFIAYCFAEVKGYSKFGSYTGNGSTDGTFVYTGFKPAFVLIKVTNTTSDWFIQDNKRLGFNASNSTLNANLSDAESSTNRLDILSNGFKLRNTSGAVNGSGNTYIYMAFAENPFVTSSGIPTTAR